ncbi:MAG: TonB-dependent receptor plug domain-containing protein [Chitinophagaceae bacterium]
MKSCICTLLVLVFAWNADGQQNAHALNPVVVTASKFKEKQSQTGKVISVISSQEIQRSEGKMLGELLNDQPGITVNGSAGTPGTNQTIYFRGASDGYALILIDGLVVYDPSQISSHFDLNLIPLDMIDHIEIIRGPASTLYGSGAIAGVINIITKKGAPHSFGGSLGVVAGSYHTYKENLGVYGRGKAVDYHISLVNDQSKGFSAALDTTGKANFDGEGFRDQAMNADFGIQVSKNLTLRPFIRYSYEQGHLDAGAFTEDKYYTFDTRFLQTGIQGVYNLKKGSIHLNYSFNHTLRNYLDDTAAGKTDFYQEADNSHLHQAEVYIHYRLGDKWQLLGGVNDLFSNTNQTSLSISSYGSYPSDFSSDSTRANLTSAYLSFFYQQTNGFNMEVGGRINHHSVYGTNPTFSFNPFYSFHGKYKIYINIGSSFNAPSLYQLYSPYGNRLLKPEHGISYEAGMSMWTLNHHLKWRATGFFRNMQEVIGFTNVYVNENKQNDEGFELETSYFPTSQLSFRGYYSYVNGRITVPQGNKDSTYYNLFKRPKQTFSLEVSYQVSPQFLISSQVKYCGGREDLDFSNYPANVVSLSPYFLWNAYAEFNWKKHFRIFGDLKNITGTIYTETLGYATRGFNMDAGIGYQF